MFTTVRTQTHTPVKRKHKSLLFQLDPLSFHLTLVQPNYIIVTLAIQWLALLTEIVTQVQFPRRVLCLTNNPTQGHQLSGILDNIEYGSWTSHNKYTVHKWQIAHIPGWLVFLCLVFSLCLSIWFYCVWLPCLSFTGRRLTVLFEPGQDVCDQSAACDRLLP